LVWGRVSFWRSLMRLDLIDEFHLDLYPYVAAEATRLFNDDVPKSYRLDLISSTAFSNGPSAAVPPAPLTQRPTCTTSGNQASAATCPRGPWPNANQPAILAASPRSTAASRHRRSTSNPTTLRGIALLKNALRERPVRRPVHITPKLSKIDLLAVLPPDR
jgi:hypothetical protein